MFDMHNDYETKLEGTHIYMEKPGWLEEGGMALFVLSLLDHPDIVEVEDFMGEFHIIFSPGCTMSVPERIDFLLQEIQLFYQPAAKQRYLH